MPPVGTLENEITAGDRAAVQEELAPDATRAFASGLGDDEKTCLLMRLMEGGGHIGTEMRRAEGDLPYMPSDLAAKRGMQMP